MTYNDFEEAKLAADTVLQHCPEAALYMIDNASADGTGEKLQTALQGRAKVICLPENIGFGKGHNTVIPMLESRGLEFQYGENVVTWISLLFY